MEAQSYRQTHSPLELIRTAVGSPEAVRGKIERVGETLRSWGNREETRRRLKALKDAGFMKEVPTPGQLAVGVIDTFRYFLIPGSDDFYQRLEINFAFHQVLRWLDDPVSMLDPSGLFSERDTIIGHLMQVTHHDPVFDLQLLVMFPDGLDEMERQLEAVLAGTHPRAKTLRATIEDPDYHEDLLEYVREFKKNPRMRRKLREGFFRLRGKNFTNAERTFSSLSGLMNYCNKLPSDPAGLLRHLLFQWVIPEEMAESEEAAQGVPAV
ncbi:MAG: hypothetical protein AB1405_02455 [Bdellovibrionota bacterium]